MKVVKIRGPAAGRHARIPGVGTASRNMNICRRVVEPLDFPIPFELVILFSLLFLSGFFSGSEASLFFLSPLHLHKMEEDRSPFAAFVRRLLARPRRLLISILVGNEAVNITIAVIATSFFLTLFGPAGKWVSIAVTTTAILVFGEALPKVLAVNYPIRFSSFVSLPLTVFSLVIRPAVFVLEKISDLFVHLLGRGITTPAPAVMEEEFISLVDAGHREGALQEAQKKMIHRVFELSDITAEEIMIPRVDMFCLPVSMTPDAMAKEMIRSRFSRAPVYGADRDDIRGIVHARDLLAEIRKGKKAFSVRKILKKPHYVPLERSAENVMRDLQARKMQMAIVVDEFGGVEGLVTMSDILETLVGDFSDGFREHEKGFHPLGDGTWVVAGTADIEKFNEMLGTSLPAEDFDTIGGLVFHLFGALPQRGNEVAYGNLVFKVEKIGRTRILRLRVRPTGEEPPRG